MITNIRRVRKLLLGTGVLVGLVGGVSACGSSASTTNSPVTQAPGSSTTTTPPTTAPSGGGVSY